MKANGNDIFEVELQFYGDDDGDAESVTVFIGIEDRRKLIKLTDVAHRFIDNDTKVIILGLKLADWPNDDDN